VRRSRRRRRRRLKSGFWRQGKRPQSSSSFFMQARQRGTTTSAPLACCARLSPSPSLPLVLFSFCASYRHLADDDDDDNPTAAALAVRRRPAALLSSSFSLSFSLVWPLKRAFLPPPPPPPPPPPLPPLLPSFLPSLPLSPFLAAAAAFAGVRCRCVRPEEPKTERKERGEQGCWKVGIRGLLIHHCSSTATTGWLVGCLVVAHETCARVGESLVEVVIGLKMCIYGLSNMQMRRSCVNVQQVVIAKLDKKHVCSFPY
jgi:hypothetical protein